MKKLLSTTLVGLICGLISCTAQNNGFKSVNVEEFEETIQGNDVIRLDVRTPGEYASGHISGAINLDVKSSDFEAKALGALSPKKTIAVYCRSGKRSKMAANILVKNGFKVVELNTGMIGWSNAGKASSKEEVDLFFTSKGTPVYTYCIKHGSVKMKIGEKWLYVDPVTTGVPPTTDYTSMPQADYILITHEHFDHLDSTAIQQLSKEGTQLIVNPRSSELLGGKGEIMKNGDKKKLEKNWTISAVPAYNTSAEKQQFHPKGRDNGYVLTMEGMNIYIAGDTEDIEEMKKIKDIDVAFLPCNLPYTMTPEQLANAAKMFQPKVLFPYHYGQTEIQQVVKLLEGTGIEVRIRQYQ